ncbi:MAG: penicillin-binding protein 1B [Methylophagaceae bacterium]|jgi:penicillin-binding protein 1B
MNSFLIRQQISGFAIKLFLGLMVVSGLGLLYLDVHIREQFEGKRWAVPAKVYARPLELYIGSALTLEELKIELLGLGYQIVQKVTQPGQAAFSQTQAIVHTRGFKFTDGLESSQRLTLEFSAGQLSKMTTYQGQPLPLLRVEPVLIGGIYPLNNEDRDLIQISDTPEALIQALVAIEDRGFYEHHGISIRGISRAMVANIKAGRFIQGGSTLTQQLIKNFYLSSDRTLTRKLLEIPMAILLELHYSKDEILEAYLNEVYVGQEGARAIHGFGLAAQYYFSQPLQELKLHQFALLAGLVKGPSYYDPRHHPDRAESRRNLVLKVLYEQAVIKKSEYDIARLSKLSVVKQASLLKGAYPAYLDLVKRQLRQDYPDDALNSEGLRVFTNLNPIAQNKAELALTKTITSLEKRHGERLIELQGSMIVTDPQTGEVIAVIGGRETRYQGFNRALDTLRPIGSLVKPAVYLTAVEQGFHLASLLDDSPFELTMPDGQIWQPENFDHQSHDPVLLHQGLAKSYNLATARLGMELGLDNVIDTLKRLGVERDLKAYPSLLLGAQGLSPLEVAKMYQTMASNGFQMPLRAIRQVTDSSGIELSRYPFELEQTVDTSAMHLLQYMLQETTRTGTARSIYERLPAEINVAGKTGTSDLQRDSWFAGFAGNRLAVVWLGLDNNDPLPFTGSSGALRVWTDYMANETLDPFIAPAPEKIEYLWIDQQTAMLTDAHCPSAQQLPFMSGKSPSEYVGCDLGLPNDALPLIDNWMKRWFQ